MTDPLFGILTRIVGVNWGGTPLAIVAATLPAGVFITNSPQLVMFNSNIILPAAPQIVNAGSAEPISSVPDGATGYGDDLALAKKYTNWRSFITPLGGGFTPGSFAFAVFALPNYTSPFHFEIAATAGASGTGWTTDIGCIVTKRLTSMKVSPTTASFAFSFGDTKVVSDLTYASLLGKAAGWKKQGLITSAAAMQLIEFNPGSVTIDPTAGTVTTTPGFHI